MTSVQERLQIKRTALDKWSIKERLCLASAVHCSGDQNWMSVSRSLKLLCSGHNRPPDWFSQKSCAVQYGELLENVETPKRKKRTNSDNQNQPAETPTESILRNLKQERINELEAIIQKERESYLKLHKDAASLQNSTASDEQIREMWLQIQKEKEQQLLEEQKYNEWLKEREQRKLELQRAWRPAFGSNLSTTIQSGSHQGSHGTNLKHEDMDIDETITPISSSIISSSKPQQTATSPLLTSLLKTPSPTIGSASVVQTSSTTSARVQAPTITNLLTGGQLPPIVPLHQQYKISHPLTGPPIHITSVSQVVQSPSQSAPTLSMLLENKNSNKNTSQSNLEVDDKSNKTHQRAEREEDGSDSPNKDELMEVFKGLIDENIDENIDELAEILTKNNAIIPEILDDALENVDLDDQLSQENHILEEKHEANSEGNNSKNVIEPFVSDKKPIIKTENDLEASELEVKKEVTESADEKPKITDLPAVNKVDKEGSENSVQFIETKEESQESLKDIKIDIKTEEISFTQTVLEREKDDKKFDISEDSGDMTVQEIANEIKEKIKAEEGQDSKESSEDVMEISGNLQSIQSIESDDKKSIFISEDSQDTSVAKHENFEKLQNSIMKDKLKKSASESSDVIIIPEDEDSNEKNKNEGNRSSINTTPTTEKKIILPEKVNTEEKAVDTEIILKSEIDKLKKMDTTTITIIDTDDDSTHTDTAKEEKTTECISSAKNNLKRELSNVKQEVEEKKLSEVEDIKNTNIKKVPRTVEPEENESTPVDDDLNDTLLPRTRRRFSSTPVIDSIPNSPASSVEINDQKAWKKTILAAYSKLMSNKNSSLFARIPNDEQTPKYKQIILHPMDLTTIKKNIDNGVIKSTNEFQRDLMLMCINAIMFYERNSENFLAAKEFLLEIKMICFKLLEKENKKDNDDVQDTSISTINTSVNITPSSASSSSSKIRSRKSQRF